MKNIEFNYVQASSSTIDFVFASIYDCRIFCHFTTSDLVILGYLSITARINGLASMFRTYFTDSRT